MPEKPQAPAEAPKEPPKAAAATNRVDDQTVIAIAERIDLAVKHAPAKVVEGPSTPATPPAPTPPWLYIGCIHESDRTLAVVSVDGHQKIVPEGRSFGDTKLVSVADDGIDIEVSGVPQTVHRSERTGSTVAWVRNMAANAAPATAGVVPGTVGAPGQLTPEVRARLAERGIDPNQAQQWRQNRGRNGPGSGPGGRGGQGRGGGNGDLRFNGAAGTTGTADGDVVRARAVPQADDGTVILEMPAPRKEK
jgi:hypothetical protein